MEKIRPGKKPGSVMEIIKIRRSARKYADTIVEPGEIELLAEVAREGARVLLLLTNSWRSLKRDAYGDRG